MDVDENTDLYRVSKSVIHVVPPFYYGESYRSALFQFRDCVYDSLRIADDKKCKKIAIPMLGTGFLNFPVGKAAKEIVSAVQKFEGRAKSLQSIVFFDLEEDKIESLISTFRKTIDDDWEWTLPQESKHDWEKEESPDCWERFLPSTMLEIDEAYETQKDHFDILTEDTENDRRRGPSFSIQTLNFNRYTDREMTLTDAEKGSSQIVRKTPKSEEDLQNSKRKREDDRLESKKYSKFRETGQTQLDLCGLKKCVLAAKQKIQNLKYEEKKITFTKFLGQSDKLKEIFDKNQSNNVFVDRHFDEGFALLRSPNSRALLEIEKEIKAEIKCLIAEEEEEPAEYLEVTKKWTKELTYSIEEGSEEWKTVESCLGGMQISSVERYQNSKWYLHYFKTKRNMERGGNTLNEKKLALSNDDDTYSNSAEPRHLGPFEFYEPHESPSKKIMLASVLLGQIGTSESEHKMTNSMQSPVITGSLRLSDTRYKLDNSDQFYPKYLVCLS